MSAFARRVAGARAFAPAVFFLVCWTLTTHGKYSASGDEPHYLVVSESLLADGDLDVGNNYARNDGRRFGADGLQPEGHAAATRRGRLFPVHDIGVAVAVLPVYTVASRVASLVPEGLLTRARMTRGLFAYSIVSLFLIALASAAAAITWRAATAQDASGALASCVVLALWLAPPVLSNGFLVFPEVFALLATAWTVRVAAPSQAPSRRALLGAALALGLLPWFHRKYAIYAVGMALALAWRRRDRFTQVPARQRGLAAAFLLLVLAPGTALAVWTAYHWGSLGGPLTIDRLPFSWGAFRTGSLGLLVDRENGLFVWAPVYLILPAAWMVAWQRQKIWLAPAVALFLMSAAHDQWWGGFSPAGRFLVPLAPIFALVGASAVQHRAFRRAGLALLVPQALIAAYGWQHPRALWPQGDGINRVLTALAGTVGSSEAILPSLRTGAALGAAALAAAVVGLANLALYAGLRVGRSEKRPQ